MAYWAFAIVLMFAITHKLRRLRTFHLEWGLLRLEFEPETNRPRLPGELTKEQKQIEE
jgi:hypothetical protein